MKQQDRLQLLKANLGQKPSEDAPPFTRWLDGKLREILSDGLVVDFVVRREMTNPLGILHGGLHAAILDEVIGMTVFGLVDAYPTVSVNLTVDYLGQARIGDTVTARSRILRDGKQIVHAECSLYKGDSLISRASSNLIKLSFPPC
ncbi:MAG: PaaI family thioesterase [Acidobacteriota bacterium]|nr:PaaI family thioesterase [Blastocatellia bacterium]MDW8413255.1 PaaI family thioesterase [Acidobacteriota bacterium]